MSSPTNRGQTKWLLLPVPSPAPSLASLLLLPAQQLLLQTSKSLEQATQGQHWRGQRAAASPQHFSLWQPTAGSCGGLLPPTQLGALRLAGAQHPPWVPRSQSGCALAQEAVLPREGLSGQKLSVSSTEGKGRASTAAHAPEATYQGQAESPGLHLRGTEQGQSRAQVVDVATSSPASAAGTS